MKIHLFESWLIVVMTDEVRIYTQQGNIHFARLRIPQVFIYITLIGARSQHLPLDKVIIYINSVPSTTKKTFIRMGSCAG